MEIKMVKTVLEKNKEKLLNKPNVVGAAIGKKSASTKVNSTGENAIIVFVDKKLNDDEIARLVKDPNVPEWTDDSIIPSQVASVPVHVVEVGNLQKLEVDVGDFTPQVASLAMMQRPIQPGYSVGHKLVSAGTIGGIFTDSEGHTVILSNCHVLGNESRGAPGDPIWQPGALDGGGESDKVADLKSFVDLKSGSITHDSAIAKINAEIPYNTSIAILGKPPSGFSDPRIGMKVQKVGRTTGHTTGEIIALNGTFKIGYEIGPIEFNDCIVTTAMSRGGDSGSLLLDEDLKIVGLLFAGSSKVSLFNKISHVRNHYGLNFV